MEELTFNKSIAPTIRVEIELQILDTETLNLIPLAHEMLEMVHPSLKEKIKPEFIQSMVEINTKTCSTSLHPFSKSSEPFYEAGDTGLMSYRAKLFESLPLARIPDSLHEQISDVKKRKRFYHK